MSLIRLSAAGLRYPDAAAPRPHDLTLSVERGEVVLLLGPSGCGKSTLALALAGLVPQSLDADTYGEIEVSGHDAVAQPAASLAGSVAIVLQDPDAQLLTASVLDEVCFALENLLLPVPEILARAEEALRRMDLWGRRDDDPSVLSGGGRQRLAIACALAQRANVIVLDEPTSTLDARGTAEVYAAISEASVDRAVVLIEHDLDAAVEVATRVVVLDAAGGLFCDGTVSEVLRDRAPDLHALGVWLPSATEVALARGIHPLPLTAAELDAALEDAEPAPIAAPATRGTALLIVRGLRVERRGAVLLDGIDLDIPRGSFTAVIGPNGAGKTTLVQALAGVVPPPRGSVRVDGMDVGRASPRQLSERVGFVFQNPEHQFIRHTVFDELAHGLRQHRLPESEVAVRVGRMLERFGLSGDAERHPYRLSGGQKRRLSVGTVLITEPDIVVLDEPAYGQDRERADELMAMLDDLHAEGRTVVVVLHDLLAVHRHADRVILMDGGRVVRHDTTEAVLAGDLAGLRAPALLDVLRRHPGLDDRMLRR